MAEKGSAFLVKLGDGATSETFTTIAGGRSHTMTINSEPVDVTNKGSSGWRELLAAAGTNSVSVGGSGVFVDNDTNGLAAMQTNLLNRSLNNYEIVFESGDKFSGSFQVTSLEYSGEYNGERTYSFSLESSGQVTFTAA